MPVAVYSLATRNDSLLPRIPIMGQFVDKDPRHGSL